MIVSLDTFVLVLASNYHCLKVVSIGIDIFSFSVLPIQIVLMILIIFLILN